MGGNVCAKRLAGTLALPGIRFSPIAARQVVAIVEVVQQVDDLVGKRRKARKLQNRRLPFGAEVLAGGGAHFRVWAPRSKSVGVEFGKRTEPLAAEGNGYFSGVVKDAGPGAL